MASLQSADRIGLLFKLTIFLTPFLIVPGIEEYTLLPRLLLLQVVVIASLLIAIHRPDHLPLWLPGPDRLFFLGFMVVLAASATWAPNAFRSTYDLAKYVTLAAFYFFVAGSRKSRLESIIQVHAYAGLTVALVGILEYHGVIPLWIPSTGRPSSFFGYRNLAAAYMACGAPLAAVHAVTGKNSNERTLGAAAAAMMVVLLAYTRARASWVGLFAGIVGSLTLLLIAIGPRAALSRVAQLSRKDGHRPVAVALLVVFSLSFLPERIQETHIQRFDERKADAGTAVASIFQSGGDRGRLHMWASTLDMISDAPILGVGLGNWEFAYVKYDGGELIEPRYHPLRPHNDLIWIWSELGTVGLVLFLGFLLSLATLACRWMREEESESMVPFLLFMSCLGFIGVGMFTFPWERVAPSLLFFLAAGWISSHGAVRKDPQRHVLVALLLVLLLAFGITIQHTLFDWHYVRARVTNLQNQTAPMLAHADRALVYGTFDHQAHSIRGEALLTLGRLEESRAAYDRVLDYHPNFPNAFTGLGRVESELGDTLTAKRHYGDALRLDPDDYSAGYNLAILLQAEGNRDSAIALYRSTYHPNRPGSYVNLGTIYREMGLPDSAASVWRQAAEALTPAPEALVNLGNLQVDAGNYDDAIRLYTEFLETPGTDTVYHVPAIGSLANAYVRRGIRSEREGRQQSAFEDYGKAVQLEPDIALHWYNLGNGYKSLGRQDKAIEAYLRATELDSTHIDTRNNLGLVYLDDGRIDEAILAYRQALRLDPSHAIVNYNLGNAYVANANPDSAQAAHARFERHWEGDGALLHYYMMPVYLELGETSEARRSAEAFLREWTGDPAFKQTVQDLLDGLDN